jgi:threonine/homoserine/homoserine lactone efflux protein
MVLVFFLKGIAVGVIIAVPVGPVGVLCLRRTIFEGQLAGLVSGLGAATADAFFGVVAAFGLSFVSQWLLGWEGWLRAAGGLYLVGIGARAIAGAPRAATGRPREAESLCRCFLSTCALTITNPITIVAFLGIFEALGLGRAPARWLSAGVLVAGVLAGSLMWWLALSFGIGIFRRAMGPRELGWISRASGAILFFSCAALLATAIAERVAHWA